MKMHQASRSFGLEMWAVSVYTEHLVLKSDARINTSNVIGLYSFHTGGANILLADGSVRLLESSTDPEPLRALITRAGND
jgi:prepilin-type processing-associated H-X9-DG protein